jgi:hypothetical protein
MEKYTKDGKKFPRVTAILAETMDEKAKEKLRKWRHKMDKINGTGGAAIASNGAKDRGTKLHELIKGYWNRETIPFTEPVDDIWWNTAKRFVKTIEPEHVLSFEQPVFHDGTYPYAGTPDLIAWCRNECCQLTPTVVDFKTSSRPKQRQWLEDYFIQCAAYAYAFTEEPIKQLAVVAISPGKLQTFYEEDCTKYYDIWFSRLERYYAVYEVYSI